MTRRIAAVLGALLFHSGLYRWFLRRRAVIVLFHRVDDRYAGDPLTCTRKEFDRYLAFFGRFFRVVSLGDLLGKLERGDDIGRHLVITFDDGYRDNHAAAAVALQRFGLPACFFIATEFIGSRRVPWWDANASIASEWMDWDQIRALRDKEFEIGAHTLNHVDLGRVDGEEARIEITGSKARLERELAQDAPFFTFPYGRPDNITEENRQRVRAAGFRCCLSAHGGVVRPGIDRFALPRIPLSPWYRSPYQFGLDVMRAR